MIQDQPFLGHLTIGGLGPLSRQWGAALDHVEEVEVVLANATITRASKTLNPDLFFVSTAVICSVVCCVAWLYNVL